MKLLSSFSALEPSTRQNLLVLFATGLFFWISITSLLPVLPAYIEDLGGTTRQIGLVMGSFAIGLLGSRTLLGRLADRRSRKIVIIIGTVVVAIAPLGYLYAKSIPLLVAIRAFHGISIAAFTTGYSALVVDLSPIKNRGELIGYMSLAVPVGMAVGPALGGLLQESVGYEPLFIISSAVGSLAAILASKVREQSREKLVLQQQNFKFKPQRSFWELFTSPSLLVPAQVLLLTGTIFGTLATFLPLFIRQSQIELNAGLFYMAAAIASFSVRLLTGKASDIYGRGLFISGSIICYCLSMVLLSVSSSPSLILLAAVAEGTGGGVLLPMTIALMSDRSYPHERGQVYAICIGGFDLGVAIAGPVLGFLAESLSYREIFAIASSLAIVALLIFITRSSKNLSCSFRFAIGRDKDVYALD
jgi:MFS family permease